MKRILFIGIILLAIIDFAFAGQTIERQDFYDRYDPTSTMVYNQTNSSATGDQATVNTYNLKTIQISPLAVNEYIYIVIEGRLADQINTPNWAILDIVEFGSASADSAKQKVIDVTEYVDFLRVGIRNFGTNGTSKIDIKGIFTNLER